ncbi:UNVERIFIED_CONTAM: hypothetical protein GTU68_065196 [Idotea baltica]|nr:hypothetical protein [Idotea baltica]
MALQEAPGLTWLVFSKTPTCAAIHAKRVTIMPRHQLARTYSLGERRLINCYSSSSSFHLKGPC